MKIVIINSGSSSIKYQLINMPANEVICSGMIDRIGLETSNFTYVTDTTKLEEMLTIANHKIGLEKIAALLMDEKVGVITSTEEIEAVGHRVVHGGSSFSNTVIITSEVKDKIRQLFELAPLHNPANLEGINVAEEIFSSAQQVAVFDTAFHQTIPVVAHKYAVQNSNNKGSKIITIHLGNGCSMTAIKDGKSIDHTLGFGPMNGLIMGTRSGDVDQSVIFYLVNSLGYSLEAVNTMLQKQSGMLGLTGYSDLRDIEANAENGNADCQLALAMNAYRIKKYIGSYTAVLNGLDAIIFTAGIGENSSYIRKLVCTDMDYFGIELDASKNEIRSKEIREINTLESKTKILVIPTNEEIEIANQVFELLTK
jgi:acetate kinase